MDNQSKFSAGEIYLLVAFAVMFDLINWIPFVNLMVTAVALPGFQIYFKIKGVNSSWSLVGNLAEIVPVVSVLPGVTAGVIGTIIMERITSSKLSQTALKTTGPAGKVISPK